MREHTLNLIADPPENLKEAQKTQSRSMEETKGKKVKETEQEATSAHSKPLF